MSIETNDAYVWLVERWAPKAPILSFVPPPNHAHTRSQLQSALSSFIAAILILISFVISCHKFLSHIRARAYPPSKLLYFYLFFVFFFELVCTLVRYLTSTSSLLRAIQLVNTNKENWNFIFVSPPFSIENYNSNNSPVPTSVIFLPHFAIFFICWFYLPHTMAALSLKQWFLLTASCVILPPTTKRRKCILSACLPPCPLHL